MFNFVVHYAYFSCMSCLQEFIFLNINSTTWKMLYTVYFENSNFGVIIN